MNEKEAWGGVYENGNGGLNNFTGDGMWWRKHFVLQGEEERYYWKLH